VHSNENSTKNKNNFEKQKPCKKKNQKDVAQASDLFYFFLIFAQNIDDMLSAIFFKKNKIDLPFFACFDFDH